MKLIKPSYKIETPINGEEILIAIEAAARTAYKSEGKIVIKQIPYTDGVHQVIVGYNRKAISAREFIPRLLKRGHEAPLELGGMINVRFICDRGVTHEIVRHRLASFVQESTRYCNYATKGEHIEFIIPEWTDLCENTWHSENIGCVEKDYPVNIWIHSMFKAEADYLSLIKQGWNPQQARSVLPNSLKTEIVVGANIREWRHIFKLRTVNGAHPQMRELMCPLLKEFKQRIPIIFDDIV